MWVVRGCDGRKTYEWDASQQFLRRSKDRRLGLEPNSFSAGRRADDWDSSWLGLKLNSFNVGRRTDAWDSSWIGLEPNSFTVGQRTDVWDSSRLGLESIDSFGHILCKEVPCLTVLGSRELTPWKHGEVSLDNSKVFVDHENIYTRPQDNSFFLFTRLQEPTI